MKRFLMIAVVVIAIIMPAMTWAQEEGLTLEGLAEQVTGLVERVEMLERLYSPDAVMDGEGSCQIAIGMGGLFGGTRGGMHPTTVAAYMAISENQVPAAIGIGIGSVYLRGRDRYHIWNINAIEGQRHRVLEWM